MIKLRDHFGNTVKEFASYELLEDWLHEHEGYVASSDTAVIKKVVKTTIQYDICVEGHDD